MSSTDHRMALPPGIRVQNFVFDRVLGHGGFGITYLGWNVSLDAQVAIKEYLPAQWAVREKNQSITPKSTADKEFFDWGLERFLDEARMMARFKHPGIVQVQHFFQAHGTAYIAMEYIEGETLDDLLKRRGVLAEQELKDILIPLLAGLTEVHEAGILHRDIKPANILLRAADGSPVLADFGAARQDVGARSRLTEVRTRHYAPTEQYSEKGHQGPWTDIYALGAVCYQALLGKVPVEAIARLMPPDPLIPATQAGKGKAEAVFLAAIDWALRIQGPDRPQEISSWQEALLGEKTVPPKDRLPTDRGSRASGWLMTLGVLLLAGAGAWWGWQQYPQWFGPGDDVARLLAAADANLRARRLTSPADNNAWDMYRRVLDLQPANPEAMAGMEQVIASYMELFDEAMGQAELDKAAGYLSRINELHPDSPMLEEGQQRLEVARQVQVDRLAEMERQRQAEVARLAEQERQRQAEAARLAEQERQRQAEAARLAEQERQRQAEAARLVEQERQRQAAETARLAEQERQRQAAETARLAEQERQRQVEAARLVEQKQQRQAAETARLAEQERQRPVEPEQESAGCELHSHEFFRRATAQEVVDCIRYGRGDVNDRDEEDMTPLHLAAIAKPSDRGIIAALLEAGADVNSLNKYGQTPLHYVAWRSSEPGIVTTLVAAGADVNIRSRDEDHALAPLHMAARFSSAPGIIAALVKAGADVNIRNRYDRTPLYFAARYSSEPSIMVALLEAGANPKLADRGGKTPWDYIQENPHLENTDAYRELEARSR